MRSHKRGSLGAKRAPPKATSVRPSRPNGAPNSHPAAVWAARGRRSGFSVHSLGPFAARDCLSGWAWTRPAADRRSRPRLFGGPKRRGNMLARDGGRRSREGGPSESPPVARRQLPAPIWPSWAHATKWVPPLVWPPNKCKSVAATFTTGRPFVESGQSASFWAPLDCSSRAELRDK